MGKVLLISISHSGIPVNREEAIWDVTIQHTIWKRESGKANTGSSSFHLEVTHATSVHISWPKQGIHLSWILKGWESIILL